MSKLITVQEARISSRHDVDFDETPSGAIVRGIEQSSKDMVSRIERGQDGLIRALKDLHGGASVVQRDNFMLHEAANAARMQLDMIYDLSDGMSRAAWNIDSLEETTREGFIGVQSEVKRSGRLIHGPVFHKGDVVDEIGELEAVSAFRKGLLTQTAKADVRKFVRSKLALPDLYADAVSFIKGDEADNRLLCTAIDIIQDPAFYLDEDRVEVIKRLKVVSALKDALSRNIKAQIDLNGSTNVEQLRKELEKLAESYKAELGELEAEIKNKKREIKKANSEDRERLNSEIVELNGSAKKQREELLAAKRDIKRIDTSERLGRYLDTAMAVLKDISKADVTPLSNKVMVKMANQGLVIDLVSHQIKRKYPEARESGSIVDINYTMLDLLDRSNTAISQRAEGLKMQLNARVQRDRTIEELGFSNHHLETLVSQGVYELEVLETLAEGIGELVAKGEYVGGVLENLLYELEEQGETAQGQRSEQIELAIATNTSLEGILQGMVLMDDHIVNLERLGSDLIKLVSYAAAANVEGLKGLTREVVLSRAVTIAAVSRVQRQIGSIGEELASELVFGNQLTSQLVELNLNSETNRARQKYEQGMNILGTCKNEKDLQLAERAFTDGLNFDPSYSPLHIGLGLVAEKRKDMDAALDSYERAARFETDNKALKAKCLERSAIIIGVRDGIVKAIPNFRSAIETDPENSFLRYSYSEALALSGFEEEAALHIEKAIIQNNQILLLFMHNPAFVNIDRVKIIKSLFDKKLLNEASIQKTLADIFLESEDKDRLFELIRRVGNKGILDLGIIHDLRFRKYKERLRRVYEGISLNENANLDREQWLAMVGVLQQLGECDPEAIYRALCKVIQFNNDITASDVRIVKNQLLRQELRKVLTDDQINLLIQALEPLISLQLNWIL